MQDLIPEAFHPRVRRRMLGSCVFLGLGLAALVGAIWKQPSFSGSSIDSMARYVWSSETVYRLPMKDALQLKVGDPLFGQHEGRWYLVGAVIRLHGEAGGETSVEVGWSDHRFQPTSDAPWEYCETPQSFAWVAQAMLPPSKREKILSSLKEHFKANQPALAESFEPMVVASFRDLAPLLQEKVRESLRQQQPRIAELSLKYQSELIEEKIIPMMKTEIMPIIEEKTMPLFDKLGSELFEKASLWRFTWRYLYDVSPLPQRDLVQAEFRRFVQRDAIPILESHADEILAAMKEIAVAIGKNPKVRQTAREAANDLFHDEQLRAILGDALRNILSDSASLKAALRKNWEGEVGQRFAMSLESMIDPWLRETGAELFGTPEDGLTPELVSVLRSQVLSKDQRWIETAIVPSGSGKVPAPSGLIRSQGIPQYPQLIPSGKPRREKERIAG